MSAAEAMEWMPPIGLAVAITIGMLMILTTARVSWIKSTIAVTTIVYGLIGGFLILSPKWQTVIAESDGKSWKFRVAELEEKLKTSQFENENLHAQINQVASLNAKGLTVEGWLNAAKQTKNDVDWAKFLPTDSSPYKVQVSGYDKDTIKSMANIFAKPSMQWDDALKDSGFVVLRDVSAVESAKTPAKELWIAPTKH